MTIVINSGGTADPAPEPSVPVRVRLVAADGYELAALRFPAVGALRGRLVVAGATGVPQGFYRRFADHAARCGFDTLTLDYRGIGLSRPDSLRGFRMSLLDWGRLDLAAAIDLMSDGGDTPLYLVGHSYGGHAFGLLPAPDKVAAFCVFGTGAGWHGWMPPLERLRVLTMWKVVLPLLTWWKGYSPWKLLGIGEDLPLDVYRQWRHWCGFPHYFFDDPAVPEIADAFARVTTPILAINALDDLWALPASRDAFLQGYRNAPVTTRDLDPAAGAAPIGHMGYFRSGTEALWSQALDWLVGAAHGQPA